MTSGDIQALIGKGMAELEGATILYKTWKSRVDSGYYGTKDPMTATAWGRGLSFLEEAIDELAPTIPPAPTGPSWGMFGSYGGVPLDPANPASPKARGIDTLVYEFAWDFAEPADGTFHDLSGDATTIRQWKAWGYKTILSYGLHKAPGWWFSLDPSATRFRDQHATTFTTAVAGADGQDPPSFLNLEVIAGGMRLDGYMRRYVQHVLNTIGVENVYAIRVGGGHFGELGYPNHYAENNYWLWDIRTKEKLAQQGLLLADPGSSTGWRPGMPSPNGEAAKLISYFQVRLNDWQNLQCSLARSTGFAGPVAVLYPSFGADNAAIAAAVAGNLAKVTSPEINGEVQRGYHHEKLIGSLTDPNPLVWCTDVSGWNGAASSRQAGWADLRGFKKGGENAEGADSTANLQFCVARARKFGYTIYAHIRAQELYRAGDLPETGTAGATIADYQSAIR